MKLKLKGSWEILLVLAIIIAGIIITTLAAIRNKDKQTLSALAEDADLSDDGTFGEDAKRPFVQPVKANGHSFPNGFGSRITTDRPLNGRTSKFDESQESDDERRTSFHERPVHEQASAANRDSQGAKNSNNIDSYRHNYRGDETRTPRTAQDTQHDQSNNNQYQSSYQRATLSNDLEDLMTASLLKPYNQSFLRDFSSTSAATQPTMSPVENHSSRNNGGRDRNNIEYRGDSAETTMSPSLPQTMAPSLTLPLPTTAILNELIGLRKQQQLQQQLNITSQQSRPPQSPLSRLNQLLDDKLTLLQFATASPVNQGPPMVGGPLSYEASESSQHFFRAPASSEVRSLMERSIPGGLPGYAAPKGTPFITIPFDQGGSTAEVEAQNRNADFVADVSGFVRESISQGQQQQQQQQDSNGSQSSGSPTLQETPQAEAGSAELLSDQQQQQQPGGDQQGPMNGNNNNYLNTPSAQLEDGSANNAAANTPATLIAPMIQSQSRQDVSMPVRPAYVEPQMQHQQQQVPPPYQPQPPQQQQQHLSSPQPQQYQQMNNNRFNISPNMMNMNNQRYIAAQQQQQQQPNRNWQPPYTMPINSNGVSTNPIGHNKFMMDGTNHALVQRPPIINENLFASINNINNNNHNDLSYLSGSNNFVNHYNHQMVPQITPNHNPTRQFMAPIQQQQQAARPNDATFGDQMMATTPMQNQGLPQGQNFNMRRMQSDSQHNNKDTISNSIPAPMALKQEEKAKARRKRSPLVVSARSYTKTNSTIDHPDTASSIRGTSIASDESIRHKGHYERPRLDHVDEMTSERDMVDDEEARPLSIVRLDGQPSDYKSLERMGRFEKNNPQAAQSLSVNHHTGDFDSKDQLGRYDVKSGGKKKDLFSGQRPLSRSNKYLKSGQAKRHNQKRKKSAQSRNKFNGIEPKASGSDLLTKLLGTASTNDELEEDLDEDDEAADKRREEIEDAEFGIPADNNEQNNSQDNQDGDNPTSVDGGPQSGVVGSGSNDNEAYARKHQQRQDIEFYGHPGEETRQLKYGILGSGNYEIVSGGIYPEADESTAAVNSVANYVRKPVGSRPGDGLLMPTSLAMDTSRGIHGDAHGALTGDEGLLKESPSPLLELIDANSGQLFDSHVLNGIGSSGSSSSSLHSGERPESGRAHSEGSNKKKQPDMNLKQKQFNANKKHMRNHGLLGFQGYDDFEHKILQSGYRQHQPTSHKSNRFMSGGQLGDDTIERHHLRNHHPELDRSTMSSLASLQVDQGGGTNDDELYINNDDNEKSNSGNNNDNNDQRPGNGVDAKNGRHPGKKQLNSKSISHRMQHLDILLQPEDQQKHHPNKVVSLNEQARKNESVAQNGDEDQSSDDNVDKSNGGGTKSGSVASINIARGRHYYDNGNNKNNNDNNNSNNSNNYDTPQRSESQSDISTRYQHHRDSNLNKIKDDYTYSHEQQQAAIGDDHKQREQKGLIVTSGGAAASGDGDEVTINEEDTTRRELNGGRGNKKLYKQNQSPPRLNSNSNQNNNGDDTLGGQSLASRSSGGAQQQDSFSSIGGGVGGGGGGGGGLNLSSSGKYASYQILPSQKVTIFSDQDLDSSAEEQASVVSLLL